MVGNPGVISCHAAAVAKLAEAAKRTTPRLTDDSMVQLDWMRVDGVDVKLMLFSDEPGVSSSIWTATQPPLRL